VVVDAVVGRAADIKPLLAEFGTWEEKKITDPAGGQGYDPAAITDYQAIDRIIFERISCPDVLFERRSL